MRRLQSICAANPDAVKPFISNSNSTFFQNNEFAVFTANQRIDDTNDASVNITLWGGAGLEPRGLGSTQ
jgi:hypothetical protein